MIKYIAIDLTNYSFLCCDTQRDAIRYVTCWLTEESIVKLERVKGKDNFEARVTGLKDIWFTDVTE